MATLAQILTKSTDELTGPEIEKVREIIRYSKSQRSTLLELIGDLTEEERQATRADFDDFDSIPTGAGVTATVGGDGSGLTYDGTKDRAAIRDRMLLRLGLELDPTPGSGGIYQVAIGTTWYQRPEDC